MTRPRRFAAALVAASIGLGGAVAITPAAHAAPTPSGALDYFADTIPGLREGSVLTPVTFERFESLLNSSGRFAFLIGGPEDATIAAAATHIDAVAAEYGVDEVYVFDPRLDGDSLDIRTTGNAELAALYPRLTTNFLNKDTTPQFGVPTTDPYLFVYDKDHTIGGAEDRIVTSLGGTVSAAGLDDDADVAGYRAQVAQVFDGLGDGGADTQSSFEFFSNAVNARHSATYADASLYGGDIFTGEDSDGFALQSMTYPELVHLLESDGEHVILFGGTWCHNTRAVISQIDRAAAASDDKTVYVFDLRLDGWSGGQAHIRDTNSAFAHLYGDLVAEHFPVLRTQYVPAAGAGQRVDYYPGGDTTVARATAQKLQVPYLVRYDKDRGGIVDDWIRDNGDGSFTEYMTEYWWVAGLPGKRPNNVTEEAWPARQAANWAFADEAVAKIDLFFADDEQPPAATAPYAPAAPSATVSGRDITVSWVAPFDGGSPITAYGVSLDRAEPIEVAPEVTTLTLRDVTPGAHNVTVSAVNAVGATTSAASVVTVADAAPSPEPVLEPTVTVTGDLRPGGSIVVTGAHLPADTRVTVELHSVPQTLGTDDVAADGSFRLQAVVPTATPAGAHAVVVLVDGVEIARAAVTITSAPAALAATGSEAPVALGVLGGALLLAGVASLTIRRRRSA
ncbi:fibronectin type III domain-containing protein [Microbacterium binotii]|uniref:fibronectin type III domain-containing protein n=1 Tax=Microbacterium binotii TaxID=462710 RepID=UPI001F1AA376|nr:fibronectin type III domain-containing protein [Microbacterium binotii]UIN30019.1 fibronectin type III domain-containing protein [Microbacterium binotii]